MSLPLYYYMVGYRTISVPAEGVAPLLELCRRASYSYADFTSRPDGGITLTFPGRISRAVVDAAGRAGIPLCTVKIGGLPRYFWRLVGRPGLIVGGIAGLLLYVAATHVVWDIRISGNQTISDRAIEETLAACGFTVGSSLRDFHADETENRALLHDERLSWISINRRGTVAYVEVREAVHTPPPVSTAPADIVASAGGIIEWIELTAGNVRVAAGMTVSPGDLLVSGLYDSERYGILYTRAEARVFARTVRVMTVEIPLKYDQKTYLDSSYDGSLGICQEKSLIFFGRHIKFSKKTGNDMGICDTIEKEAILSPVSSVDFPISVRTVWYLPYTVTTATRTYAEAEELAYVELARRIAALPRTELLNKTVSVARTPDALVLTCTLTCIEDIGLVREIEIVGE